MTDHVKNIKECHWYAITNDGRATLCKDEQDAQKVALQSSIAWPRFSPHKATQLVPMELVTALLGELEAAKKDAERYRWLRDEAINHGNDDGTPTAWCVLGRDYQDTRPVQGEELDEAIDAAIKGSTP